MGQFLKFFTASCLGVIVAIFILVGVSSILASRVATLANQPKKIKPNSVLKITFNQPVPEKTNNLQSFSIDIDEQKILGLQEIKQTLAKAAEDDKIKGLYLAVDGVQFGLSTAAELRDAIVAFKESGKFVIANSKFYSQGAYYLASTADHIFLNPLGLIDFRGFAAQIPFYKNMLDKTGIKMQIYYAGQFKSATEPYRLTKMSEQNRLQTRVYIDDIYNQFLSDISESRNISVAELKVLADRYVSSDPDSALHYKLITELGYEDDLSDRIREELGLEAEDKIPLISLKDYNASNPVASDYGKKNKIAVVYAEGTIIDGKGTPGQVGDVKYTEIIRKIRKDEKVKAIVLRVNSPGGSAISSENIWKELSLAKEEGTPIVVSMGDYAASGGYYISCMADTILAEPNTLTGSIGVFTVIPNVGELFNDKLGINYDTVKTGDFSTGLTPYFALSPEQGRNIQTRTDKMYEIFLKRVAEGRGMSRDEVHEVAQGRVWTGNKALEVGLVDQLGGLEEAIEIGANLADVEAYRIVEYPVTKDPYIQLIEEWIGETTQARTDQILQAEFKEWYPVYKAMKEMRQTRDVQARLPVVVPFH